MDSSTVTFSQLKSARGFQRIVGRALRFWEARNIKKGGELMGIDMVLLDEKSTMMQASVHVHHIPTFQPILREGLLYAITGFEVTRSSQRFKVTDFHLSIRLNQTTTMVPLDDNMCQIPKELFRFRTYEQLIALGNTNIELPDIVGEVCSTKAYFNETTSALQRILVHLRLESGEKLRLSAFDGHATTLNQIFGEKEAGTCVMLATNINPKLFGGDLYLNATSGTKFYFDGSVQATNTLLQRLKCKETPTSKTTIGVQKIEHVSITELNDFVFTSDIKEAEFLCTAEVVDIQSAKGWCYISCSKCAKKLIKTSSTLTCHTCNSTNSIGDVKYRVEMVVTDDKDTTVFVVFDKDMVKLTNKQAAALSTEMEEANPAGAKTDTIPDIISDIKGKKYTFHIRIGAFNFTPHHRSFTVSRIFDKPQDVPKATFGEEATVGIPEEQPKEGMASSGETQSPKDKGKVGDSTFSADEPVSKKKKHI